MKLAKLLRKLRGERTYRDMEKLSGVSYVYWHQIESGSSYKPSIETVKTLIEAFPNKRKIILSSVGLGNFK